MQISGGRIEKDIIIGNLYDKYGSKNLLVRKIMQGFESALERYVTQVAPKSIHEVGCGEGYWVLRWSRQGISVKGSDFSSQAIQLAQLNASSYALPSDLFKIRSIYDLDPQQDTADLIVCCEVLEHLENPLEALATLQSITNSHLILSVPREPLWCFLNIARGKYLGRLGNTPGHIQHWSKRGFIKLVSRYFKVIDVTNPLPWTMLLCKPY